MDPERWRRIEEVYGAALKVDQGQRIALLGNICDGDESLRLEVESLLAGEKQAATFLESPALEVAAKALADAPVPSGTQIGPYRILDFLRAGGMGEVYRARDTRLDRLVAIKFLPRVLAGDTTALDRFRREARAASALNHPHICTLHDIGDFQGRPFFVMELLEGRSLEERIGDKPIPILELVDVAIQACDALRAAHAKGIIHRDIKPGNISLSINGQIKILDFGLAKLVEESHSTTVTTTTTATEVIPSTTRTRPGRLMGTPAYLSPEQARSEEVDARTDIFSLGLVLYEMATGRPTFRGRTSGELIEAILHETPAKPSTLNSAVPARLERIILRTLEKDRRARYQSAHELLADLTEFQRAKQRRAVWTARAAVAAATLAVGAVVIIGILPKRSIIDTPNILQRQVTSNPVSDSVYVAAISDDGKTVAYTDLRGVHVRVLDTGEVYNISVPPGFCFR
jgi:serine/threonine protein kinase